MHKWLAYRGRRTLVIILSSIMMISLICLFVLSNERIVKRDIFILTFSLLIVLIEFYVFIFEQKILDCFTKIGSAMLPLLLTQNNITKAARSVALFLSICFAFYVLLFYGNGYFRSLRKQLIGIRDKVWELLDRTDFIKQNSKTYPLNTVKINTIPNEIENVSSVDFIGLKKALKRFGRGAILEKNTKKGMLVIGNFASGKSSAVLKYAYDQMGMVVNPNAIPLYIRLMDRISSEQAEQINSLIDAGDNTDSLSKIADEIRNAAYIFYGRENKALFGNLHKESRIVYLFDGFNEILQREGKNKDEKIFANKLYKFLWTLSGKNRFILTTSTHPDVITNRMLKDYEDKTDIYVIKGVDLSRKETERQWEAKYRYEALYNSCAALYRLKQAYNEELYTPYDLIYQYVRKAIPNLDEIALHNLLNYTAEEIKKNPDNPYLPFSLKEKLNHCTETPDQYNEFVKSRLFREHSTTRCTICHTLIFEFILAFYAKDLLVSGDTDEIIQLFIGPNPSAPNLLKHLHLQDAFKMMMVDSIVHVIKGKDEKGNKDRCKQIISDLWNEINLPGNDDNKGKFFLLLSRIQDEIMLFNDGSETSKGHELSSYQLYLDNLSDEISNSYTGEKEVSKKFQLCKLMNINIQRENFKELLEKSMQTDWTHIGIKRKILRYYIETLNEWPETLGDNEYILDFDSYLLQEYPAELLELDTAIRKKKIKTSRFYKNRIRGIKCTTAIYWLLAFIIVSQIAGFLISPHGINVPALVIKFIGLSCCFISMNAWRNQLWKNEEYYGLMLGEISQNEPVYELLNTLLGRRDGIKYAKTLIGDWLRNRPSIAFLLISVMAVVFFHDCLMGLPFCNITYDAALGFEKMLAIGWIFMFCLPISTYHYAWKLLLMKNGIGSLALICAIFIVLIAILFQIPIVSTSRWVKEWGTNICWNFVIISFLLLLLSWCVFIRKAHGIRRKTKEKEGANPTRLGIRCSAFIAFLVLFCGPGIIAYFIALHTKIDGLLLATILISLLTIMVFLSLLYASQVRIKRNRKNDNKRLRKTNSENEWANLKENYKELSCGGQIELLNRLVEDKDKTKGEMAFLKENAKTVAAIDILLDAEI